MRCERCGKYQAVWSVGISHLDGTVDEDVQLCKKCTVDVQQEVRKSESCNFLIIPGSWNPLVPLHEIARKQQPRC